MKKTITVSALALTLAGGSLSAQLDVPTPISNAVVTTGFFHSINTAMFEARSDLFVPDYFGSPTLPTGAAVYDSFTFLYDSLTFANPQFVQSANQAPIAGQTALHFELIQPNTEAFVAYNFFNVGFFGNNAGQLNSIFMRDREADVNHLVFRYDVAGAAPNTNNQPLAYQFNLAPGAVVPTEFLFYNNHQTPVPFPGQQFGQMQGNPFNWRIFKMTASSDDLGPEFIPGELGVTRNPDGGVYILMLDDRFPDAQDWDDGFILLSGFVAEVPEPSVIGLAAVLGLGGLIWFRRRKNSKAS